MGNIISFEKWKKKKKEFNLNKKRSQMAAEKATRDGSRIDIDYAEMEPEQKVEYWKNIEKEEEERFSDKYSDVLAVVPVAARAKIQYFANIMLQLLPDIFHGSSWDIRFDTWMDFCEFYISEFDPAYSNYLNSNKEFEKPYSYNFKPISEEKLEDNLRDCLKKIVEIYPERKEENKIEMLYQAARLFELEEILSGIFYKKLMEH